MMARCALAGQPRRSAQAVANRNSTSSGQEIQNQVVAYISQTPVWVGGCLNFGSVDVNLDLRMRS